MDRLTAAAAAAHAVGPVLDRAGGPLGIVGRVMGLGGDELDAGVPGWAWIGVGVVCGGIGMYFLKDRFDAFAGR